MPAPNGFVYLAAGSVTDAGQPVFFSANSTVGMIDISTSDELVGLTTSAPSGGSVTVETERGKTVTLDLSGSLTNTLAVNQRLYISSTGGAIDNAMPTTSGYRVWKLAVVSDITTPSAALAMTLFEFVKTNA